MLDLSWTRSRRGRHDASTHRRRIHVQLGQPDLGGPVGTDSYFHAAEQPRHAFTAAKRGCRRLYTPLQPVPCRQGRTPPRGGSHETNPLQGVQAMKWAAALLFMLSTVTLAAQ